MDRYGVGMVLIRPLAGAAVALALLLAAPAALAQSDLFQDFQGDGQIDPCAYSPDQLQNGLDNLPPDLQQYAPGFADQLRAGLEAQCGGTVAPTTESDEVVPTAAPPQPPATTTKIPRPPAPKVSATADLLGEVPAPSATSLPAGSNPPEGLLPLLLVGAMLLLLALVAAMRLSGLGADRVVAPLRVAFADAGARTGDALAYAWDLVRFGR